MKVQSDHIPEPFVKSRGKTQVNYNIREVEITDEMDSKTRTAYEYDMVEIEGDVTRDKIVSAILTAEHSIDEQLAILYNKMMSKDVAEYDAYQNRRAEVKQIVDDMLQKTKTLSM